MASTSAITKSADVNGQGDEPNRGNTPAVEENYGARNEMAKTLRSPQATDFTAIIEGPNREFGVRISRPREVMITGFSFTRDEAKRIELAINEAMIDFHHAQERFANELRDGLDTQR